MEVFLRNPGQTLPRQLLLTRVWGLDADVEEGNLTIIFIFCAGG